MLVYSPISLIVSNAVYMKQDKYMLHYQISIENLIPVYDIASNFSCIIPLEKLLGTYVRIYSLTRILHRLNKFILSITIIPKLGTFLLIAVRTKQPILEEWYNVTAGLPLIKFKI